MFHETDRAGGTRWPLVRVQAHGQTQVTLLSQSFLPLTTHFHQRSLICPGDNCPLCELMAPRGLFYLAVLSLGRVSILELSSMASSHLEQHLKLLHGGFQIGLTLQLTRRTAKSPLHCEAVGSTVVTQAVPQLLLASRVAALYLLPCSNPDESFEAYSARLERMARDRAESIAARLRASSSIRA